MTQSVHTDSHQTVAAARRPLTAIALAAGVALLAGCSTTFSTQVTNFNQWPQHTRGATYTIVQNPQPGTLELSELERQTYENQLSRALQAQGLVPAARPESARLEADMGVTLKREIIEYTRPVYRDMPWWGWPGYNFGPGFGPWDHWEDGGLGGAWGGMYLDEQLVRQPLGDRHQHMRAIPGRLAVPADLAALDMLVGTRWRLIGTNCLTLLARRWREDYRVR